MIKFVVRIDGLTFNTKAYSSDKAINNVRHQYATKFGVRIEDTVLLPFKVSIDDSERIRYELLCAQEYQAAKDGLYFGADDTMFMNEYRKIIGGN